MISYFIANYDGGNVAPDLPENYSIEIPFPGQITVDIRENV